MSREYKIKSGARHFNTSYIILSLYLLAIQTTDESDTRLHLNVIAMSFGTGVTTSTIPSNPATNGDYIKSVVIPNKLSQDCKDGHLLLENVVERFPEGSIYQHPVELIRYGFFRKKVCKPYGCIRVMRRGQ